MWRRRRPGRTRGRSRSPPRDCRGESEKHAVRAQPRRSASEGKPLLALVQVPATGERAVSSAISRSSAHQRKPGSTLEEEDPEKTRGSLETIATSPWLCKAVGDYVPYGLYQRLLPHDTRFITVLRDPVERVLAQYNTQAAPTQPDSATSSESGNLS